MTTRGAARSAVVLLVVAGLVVAIVVSVRSSQRLDHQQAQLRRAVASTRATTVATDHRVAALQLVIAAAAKEAAADRSDAHDLDDARTRIQQLRTAISATAARLKDSEKVVSVRQSVVDQLGACQSVLDSAAAELGKQPADTDGATSVLGAGANECAAALDLADGDTGAVHPYDFADPSVLAVDGDYYAFSTNGPAGNVQVLTSADLAHWQVGAAALANLPKWASAGDTWAPSVHQIGKTYLMYYAVRLAGSSMKCISVAVSTQPAGPYIDPSGGPLVCQQGLGGSIDPDLYTDAHGFMHLTWKSEGTPKQPAQLWSSYLSGDGTKLLGTPYLMLTADQPWEGWVIENPTMVPDSAVWSLLFSANDWNTGSYSTGFAVCVTENGPCAVGADPTVLSSSPKVAGPGGAQVFTATDGSKQVAYAAWDANAVGYPNVRRLHIATLTFALGRPILTNRT